MPYRRLPNTDQARLRSLKRAIQRSSEAEFGQNPLTFKTRTEAEHMLSQFSNQLSYKLQTIMLTEILSIIIYY